MKQLVENFTTQLQEAILIGQSFSFKSPSKKFSNIVLAGLGGSGIGGSIVQNYVSDTLKIPFFVSREYVLPGFVNNDSLVIVSSYSGNTEETIASMRQALRKKATVICITSGGKIAEVARKQKLDCILLPAGMPPRACLGYSLVQILYILGAFKLIRTDFEKELKAAIRLLTKEGPALKKAGRGLAKKLLGKTPVIYTSRTFEGVAIRFRQQLNENSKMLAWHQVIPEMNHNELVGWRDKDDTRAVVFIRDTEEMDQVRLRMDLNKQAIRQYTRSITELYVAGKSFLEKAFYIIHLTDWTSVFLADLRGVDATEVRVIDQLKNELAKKRK